MKANQSARVRGSAIAAQAGASSVLGVDTSAHVLECARRIAARTPYAPTFIHKDCRRLEAGRDFDEKADVLVMESFDYGLLGEGCLHFARHAWTHCLREDARVVPRGATLRAMLVQLGSNDEDLDVSCLTTQRFQSDYYGLQLREEPHKRLSEPFDVFGEGAFCGIFWNLIFGTLQESSFATPCLSAKRASTISWRWYMSTLSPKPCQGRQRSGYCPRICEPFFLPFLRSYLQQLLHL